MRALGARGARVFLDLKFHDIPNTVAQAVDAAVQTGAWMINVHASGGIPMMQAAARAVLRETGVERSLMNQMVALAKMAQAAGLDGVVASPQETASIRDACGDQFLIVTPGIRGASAGAERHDQMRTMGPAEAVRAGASYIVVGRPIIAAPDPRAAAEAILTDLLESGSR